MDRVRSGIRIVQDRVDNLLTAKQKVTLLRLVVFTARCLLLSPIIDDAVYRSYHFTGHTGFTKGGRQLPTVDTWVTCTTILIPAISSLVLVLSHTPRRLVIAALGIVASVVEQCYVYRIQYEDVYPSMKGILLGLFVLCLEAVMRRDRAAGKIPSNVLQSHLKMLKIYRIFLVILGCLMSIILYRDFIEALAVPFIFIAWCTTVFGRPVRYLMIIALLSYYTWALTNAARKTFATQSPENQRRARDDLLDMALYAGDTALFILLGPIDELWVSWMARNHAQDSLPVTTDDVAGLKPVESTKSSV